MESIDSIFARYRDLQAYVGWSLADVERIAAAGKLLAPFFPDLVHDFFAEIQQHPAAAKVITGGVPQVSRLKETLVRWLGELFNGPYDEQYVSRRLRVGLRHVEIGLPQVYTAVALSRLRSGIVRLLWKQWGQDQVALALCIESLNKLLDLDLAVIGDAYEREYVARQQASERCRTDDVLHREKELSGGLLAHAQAAVLVLDRTGRIVRFNSFLGTLTAGFADGPLENLDWFDSFLAPQDRTRLRDVLLGSMTPGPSEPVTVSSTIECRDRRRRLHWSIVRLHDAAGLPFAILVIGHDITDLHESQQRALQAERLAAIGQMATGLAHESRNALQRIGAAAEVLESEFSANPSVLELVGRIQRSQRHLHQLLEEVRNYAAPIVLDPSSCRVTEVWREAWDLLRTQRNAKRASLREHIEATDLVIEGDRFRLVQAFRNLLENSLAAGGEDAPVVLTCESAALGHPPGVRIRIRDYGTGLSPEQRRRTFEPFYTTKPTGTGLGTAIAQRLIEAHGGTICVGDCKPPGTEMIVTLPFNARDYPAS